MPTPRTDRPVLFGMTTTKASAHYTPIALKSFFSSTTIRPEDHFVLIDNDESLSQEDLIATYPIELLRNRLPLGFAANANQMVNRALTRHCDLVFMNNDIVFPHEWETDILSGDDRTIFSPLSNREVQYCISITVPKSDHEAKRFQTQMTMSLNEYLPNIAAFSAIAEAHSQTARGELAVYALPFFCVKIPLPILQSIGLFDERFGSGGAEDYDYCLRARLAGFEVKFLLSSYLLHFGGRSSWAAEESRYDHEERERKFRQVFTEKWGSALHDLLLGERIDLVQGNPILHAAAQRGDLRSVILGLIPPEKTPPAIKVE